ncbi:NAD(P)H-hydrate dehydratase [Erythrobacter sp. HKB08]|uniref:NAD(P)H-hydrate dehydratase n=1 Tax=Erythrobacter sp. HKB08 TaxID=2502843 RepID=UPI0010089B04|nr:NAD(P)H-hydrate dehydratase [Erythrobacter sp. HKB08]
MTNRKADQILSVAQMQAAEKALMDAGTSVDELMQRAGRGAAEIVWRIGAGRPVTILCGPGNNGGDGYVIAQALHERSVPVTVVAPMEPKTDAARTARSLFAGNVQASIGKTTGHVFVDCLFGSGLTRGLSPELLGEIEKAFLGHDLSVAIDLPSGIEADSGDYFDRSYGYDCTVALGAWKYAHFCGLAATQMGRLHLVDIGVEGCKSGAYLMRRPAIRGPWAGAHKYTRGLLAVIGGEMPGAPMLSAKAAMHAGAGYVKLFTPEKPDHVPHSLVVDTQALDVSLEDPRLDALLIGPGLGIGDVARERLRLALDLQLPTVLDADALQILDYSMLQDADPESIVATPHEGELNTLCKAFGVEGETKRHKAAGLQGATGMTVIAKGPDTTVHGEGDEDGETILLGAFEPASSWLSVAGSGDVLAGIVASRLATGDDPFDAACRAVWLHGEAARQCGPAFTADELADAVPLALAACL